MPTHGILEGAVEIGQGHCHCATALLGNYPIGGWYIFALARWYTFT